MWRNESNNTMLRFVVLIERTKQGNKQNPTSVQLENSMLMYKIDFHSCEQGPRSWTSTW